MGVVEGEWDREFSKALNLLSHSMRSMSPAND